MKLMSILLLSMFVFLLGCENGNKKTDEFDIKVSSLSVIDYGNNANASDIRISFVKPEELAAVNSFRIFVVKSNSTSSFNLVLATSLSSDRFLEVTKTTTGENIDLPANLLDSDGEEIVEGSLYKIVVLSVAAQIDNQDNQLSSFSAGFQLERKNVVKSLAHSVDGGSGGVAVDAEGNIYMADFGQTLQGPPGNKIFKITPEGNLSTFATGFIGASGNDFDSQGNLFQSNIQGGSISKVTPQGEVSTFVSGNPLNAPVGISIDENDDLFVANCEGHQILKVTKDGEISVFSNDPLLNCPNGITRDESGNIYTSNFFDDAVLKITPEKEVTVLARLPRGNTANGNNGHITYYNGFLYAVARSANQIMKISLNGDTEVFAGNGLRGSKDGSAENATFSLPNDLIFSKDGSKLYINDVVPITGSNIAPCNIRVIEIVE